MRVIPTPLDRLVAVLTAIFLFTACDSRTESDSSGGGSAVPQPVITSINPPSGPVSGGTILQIAGAGFDQGVTKVTVGGTDATQILVARDSQMSCVAPPGDAGPVDIVITTELATITVRNAFSYFNPLSLTAVEPAFGSVDGGTEITLRGSGFNAGLVGVTVGGVNATELVRVDDGEARCITPPGTVGPADVTLTANSGQASIPGGFNYGSGPTILEVSPPTGFEAGGFRIELTGTGFAANGATNTTVTVGGVDVIDAVVLSDNLIRATAPPNPVGPAIIEVSNSNGTGQITGGFVYYGLPMQIGATDTRIDANALTPQDPRVAMDGNRVYVTWADTQAGNGDSDIRFNWSDDGGITFQAQDVRIDTAPDGADSIRPQVVADGSDVYVVWEDTRNGATDIYFTHSGDGGMTWPLADERVCSDPPGAAASERPQLCSNGNFVYVLWTDLRDGYAETYFNRSIDSGFSFETDRRVDTDPADSVSTDARMCCDGARVFIAWEDQRSGDREIRFNGSLDAGSSFYTDDVRLDVDNPVGSASAMPQIACDGARIYVVWHDYRAAVNEPHVWFNRSTDGGNSWLVNDLQVDGGAPTGMAPIAIDAEDQTVCVAWEDTRAAGETDVWFNRSVDGGDTWIPGDVRLDTDAAGAAASGEIVLCLSGDNVFVAWADGRNAVTLPGEDIYLNHSIDGGATWLAADLRMDTDASDARAITPQIVCDGALVLIGWHDFRDGFGNQLRLNRSVP